MRKFYLLIFLFLLIGCNGNVKSVDKDNNDISINYIDFNKANMENIHLKNFSDLNLDIFEINTEGNFTYDISLGYKTYKFGELIDYRTMIISYGNDSQEESYVSFLLDNDEEEIDKWDVVVRIYSNTSNSSVKSTVIMSEFGTGYKSNGNMIPHNIDVEPGKELSLITYHYTNKNSYSIEGIDGRVNNKEEMDYLIMWYVSIDNILYKSEK